MSRALLRLSIGIRGAYQLRDAPRRGDVVGLRAALRGNQEETNTFFLATEGMIPRERFFNPETMQRLLASA